MDRSLARRLWRRLEAYHAVVYFAPEKKAEYDAAGLKGGWMGYFAGRAAPLGPASAELVTAVFYNFHPAMVRRSIPDAWSFSTPGRVLEARLRIVDAALRRLLGDRAEDVADAADVCLAAAAAAGVAGRPLFAANAALAPPPAPHLRLWHATTLLREHRGDGHVAALVAAGIDGCEAHLTLAATGGVPESELQPNRGWSDEEWAAARERLVERGLLDEGGRPTPEGADLRRWVEERTDELAIEPWRAAGEAAALKALELLAEPVRAIVDGGGVPFPNPMGLPRPV
ncbi:MAG TPA: hypothetical protein VHN37_14895 [Actinomycetota bacterium]|nr:hypothetical protein [Actinomycetota bacterium]